MQKGKIQLINSGKKFQFTERELQILTNDTLTVKEARIIFNYIYSQRKFCQGDSVIDKVNFVLSIYKKKNDKYSIIFKHLFPNRYDSKNNVWVKDLIGEAEKKIISSIKYLKQDIDINKAVCLTNELVELIKNQAHPYWIFNIMKLVLNDILYSPSRIYKSFGLEFALSDSGNEKLKYVIDNQLELHNYTEKEQKLLLSLPFKEFCNILVKDCNETHYENCKINRDELNLLLNAHNHVIGWTREIFPLFTSERFFISNFNHSITENIKMVLPSSYINVCDTVYYIKGKADAGVLTLQFGKSEEVLIRPDNENAYVRPKCADLQLLIFDQRSIYERTFSGKHIPFSLKRAVKVCADNPLFCLFYKQLIEKLGEINPIYKDFQRWIGEDNMMLVPATFNELYDFHSVAEFFHTKYKLSRNLNYRWNVRSINLSYLILKSWNYVDEKNRNKLIQITELANKESYYNQNCSSVKGYITTFLSGYVLEMSDCDENTIYDYVSMCLMARKKVKINIKSSKKIQEMHDRMSEQMYMKQTSLVKVKKDTRFKELRKILPKDFEWIKSRKRLIQETVMQHHCVWSYADRINRDVCQIYSYVNNEQKRYTLEFCYKGKEYKCIQVQGEYDCGDPDGVRSIVDKILREYYAKLV